MKRFNSEKKTSRQFHTQIGCVIGLRYYREGINTPRHQEQRAHFRLGKDKTKMSIGVLQEVIKKECIWKSNWGKER